MGCGFRSHAGELREAVFLGGTFRASEILGAIMRVQLRRLDSILSRLRQRRDWLAEAIRQSGAPLRLTPSKDWDGDCGCGLGLIFDSADERRQVCRRAAALDPRASLWSPSDSGLHVYTNWAPLLEQRGGHHPALNPFLMPANRECRLQISADSCPRTLDILSRTAIFSFTLEMDREYCAGVGRALCRAAKEVSATQTAATGVGHFAAPDRRNAGGKIVGGNARRRRQGPARPA